MYNVDEIWKKASERFPTSTTAWLKNCSRDPDRAKLAIVDALRILCHQLDNDTSSGSSMLDADDAVALVRLMMEQLKMTAPISPYLNDYRSSAKSRENHILHVAAKNGCIGHLRRVIKRDQVGVLNSEYETPLHLAAEFEHVDDVRILLLEFEAEIEADRHGCTPLHSAALSISPNAAIARLLVHAAANRGDNFRLLNEQSNQESGLNTALHVAAGNVNVTLEFIKELRDTDPRLQNAEHDTPFHVAAMSSNPNIIVYMLSTFKPTIAGWDIDSVDENRDDTAPTLLNMCAGNGNAEAVALLIQHGADILRGVLHEIVTASVKKPEMTVELLAVYQAVVDHAVTWRCRKNNRKCLLRGSSGYNEVLRETMIYLTTKPFVDGKNMIQRAIELGASEMLTAILNTNNVYKFDKFGVDRRGVMCSYSRYDVTNFARASTRPVDSGTSVEDPPADKNEGQDIEVDFKKYERPTTPYLEDLMLHQDEWKDKNILAVQPLRKMTSPYFGFVRGYYFLLGLFQLMFMIFFSAYYIPDTCTLASMFGSNMSRCNISMLYASLAAVENNFTAAALERESPSWFWLTWPVIVSVISMRDFILYVWSTIQLARYARNSDDDDRTGGLKVLKRRNLTRWPIKMFMGAANSFPLMSFCVSVFVWFYRHAHSDDRLFYLEALSMVFLFGWMVNFVLFSRVTEHLYVFLIVLKEIIVQDIILRFNLLFFCTVVGFSFSLYVLRMKDEMAKDIDTLVRRTGYDVFASALGIGSFFQDAKKEMNNQMGLFRIVFAFYIFFTAIILLNVLIAMVSNRYEVAKKRAEGVWRFEVIKTAHILENFNFFSRYLPVDKCNLLCCYLRDLYEDEKIPGRVFVDVRLKVEDG